MKLDVQIQGRKVAQLYRERDEYLLRYLADTKSTDFVSLAMPVREEAWRWPRDLHPFFRQNLPEGHLLSVIREEFGPHLDGTDLSLLAVVGGMGIGRVTVTPEGVLPGFELDPLQIESILTGENTADYFAELVRKYARAAISGAVPKFLAANTPEGTREQPSGKTTIRTSSHIIKGSDEQTPFLGFNEFYAMRVIERLNVAKVATTRMSEDGRVLIVDRFDVDERGMPLYGLEDVCGLLGLPPHEKYQTTTEKVLNAARAYLPSAQMHKQLEQFGWHLLTNYVVRNADCHSKNIALYYTSLNDVSFTPIYDIVTTQAYPRFASNPPGLSVAGRKTWAPGSTLETFFKARLGIPPKQYHLMVEALCDSAVTVGKEMIQAAKQQPQWHSITKQMLHAWNEGMASLRNPKASSLGRGLDAAIEEAGFSYPEPADSHRKVIGRSVLLPK
ncbi:MAG: type II toxin-antitoxin system HipA family toxin [Agitococcus sp.]|nr:type II toxin-antitoxin system HipA family toxin [Agitococcus sp.]